MVVFRVVFKMWMLQYKMSERNNTECKNRSGHKTALISALIKSILGKVFISQKRIWKQTEVNNLINTHVYSRVFSWFFSALRSPPLCGQRRPDWSEAFPLWHPLRGALPVRRWLPAAPCAHCKVSCQWQVGPSQNHLHKMWVFTQQDGRQQDLKQYFYLLGHFHIYICYF